jgi:hypothetical protein
LALGAQHIGKCKGAGAKKRSARSPSRF